MGWKNCLQRKNLAVPPEKESVQSVRPVRQRRAGRFRDCSAASGALPIPFGRSGFKLPRTHKNRQGIFSRISLCLRESEGFTP